VTDGPDGRLTRFGQALVDQRNARVLVHPHAAREGFWFGGGNVAIGPDGAWYLVGRYRDAGDSRSGTGMGPRGLELAVFKSTDGGTSLSKVLSFSKPDLDVGEHKVISIEGAKLRFDGGGVELFVSTEKSAIPYPAGLESFLKPGAGVWTIDRLRARTVEELKGGRPETLIAGSDARWLHAKDPVLLDTPAGDTLLYFCTHPFNWSSSNSALAVRARGRHDFSEPSFQFFPRGYTWDVAISRISGFCPVPRVGGIPPGLHLVFYDGGESIRRLEEHSAAVSRPRGYSCEELGGLGMMREPRVDSIERLSVELPAFVSPHGTGCSRYVSVLETSRGYFATWQQSQPDFSQPLVCSFLSREGAERILRA
jgi:hypothetical protein